MKKFFLVGALLAGALAAKAQSITIINNTACTFGANVHVSNSASPCQPVGGQSCGIPLPGIGRPAINPFSSSTYGPVEAPCYIPPPPAPTPPGALYSNVDFEWIAIQEPWFGIPPNTNPIFQVGTANCGIYPVTLSISTGCGARSLTWTDLGGGNAQVDIN